jgi:small conductance mechanosensitive channel
MTREEKLFGHRRDCAMLDAMWILAQTVVAEKVSTEPLSTTEQLTRYGQKALDALVEYAPKLGIALVMAFVGWKLANLLSRWLHRLLTVKAIDPSLRPFLGSLLDAAIKVALVVTLIGYLGIPTASFVAVIGAAGVAVGLALSGTLQNFAGGVILLVLRPFTVGDSIKAQSFEGKVKEILIFQTVLATSDGVTVFIPNGKLINESIINYSTMGTRRIDITFSMAYADQVERVREILIGIIRENNEVLGDPAPVVIVKNLGSGGVDLEARFWVRNGHYVSVSAAVRERAKQLLDDSGKIAVAEKEASATA